MFRPYADLHVVPKAVHVFRHGAHERDVAITLKRRTATPMVRAPFDEQLLGCRGVFIDLALHARAYFFFQQFGVPLQFLGREPGAQQFSYTGEELEADIVGVQFTARQDKTNTFVSFDPYGRVRFALRLRKTYQVTVFGTGDVWDNQRSQWA